MTIRPNRLFPMAGHFVILALLLLPQAAPAAESRLVEAFNSICTDTFPSFQAMQGKVEALGGSLEPPPDRIARVPFVMPNAVKRGSNDGWHANPIVDYTEGVALDLPAAGCSIVKRGAIDEATIARLLGSFETAIFVDVQKEALIGGGSYRAWLVHLHGRRAVLTIMEPQFAGKTMGALVALVRFDERLIDRTITPQYYALV